jgi:hypothetical protein
VLPRSLHYLDVEFGRPKDGRFLSFASHSPPLVLWMLYSRSEFGALLKEIRNFEESEEGPHEDEIGRSPYARVREEAPPGGRP